MTRASSTEPSTATATWSSGGSIRPIISIDGLDKAFGGTHALAGVSLELHAGEVHALLGQNGSGKSTLIKVLSGYYTPDGGSVVVRGEPVRVPLPARELRRRGIEFVHQDLGLVPTMSVLENVRVGRYDLGLGGRIRWGAERARIAELLRRFGLERDPDAPVGQLSRAEAAIVGILRAIQDVDRRGGDGVLVLDEPTASLPANEVGLLFDTVRRVAAAGWAVLFVTHDIDEVFVIADRVSVLRDGRLVATRPAAELGKRELVRLIVGRDLPEHEPSARHAGAEVVMEVRAIRGAVVDDVTFPLHRGEVLGLTGLVGAGHDELPYLVYGARTPRSGSVRLGDATIAAPSPERSKRAGVALLPSDRQRESGIPRGTVKENVTLPRLSSFRARGRLDHRGERTAVEQILARFQVQPRDPDRALYTLSGGNQQKALLARWLEMQPRVLLLHEPVQGVDVGARQGIFRMLREAAERGTGIVYASADYEDLARICDRVLVFRRGRIAADLSGEALTHDQIIANCYQTPEAAPVGPAAGGEP